MAEPVAEVDRGSSGRRTTRKRAERIERVERAAARMFAERGYEAASFDDIAALVNMRGPSLYYYFSSKEELYLRCMENSAERVFAELEPIAESDVDALERLRLLFRAQVLMSVRELPEFVPLFLRVPVPVHSLEDRRREFRRRHESIFGAAAEAAAKGTGLPAEQVRISLFLALSALGYLTDWYDPNGRLGPEEFANEVSYSLIRLFRSAPADTC